MFANNSDKMDYLSIAMVNAMLIRRHMGVPVAVVVDTGSMEWFREQHGDMVDKVFDYVIVSDAPANQRRAMRDTQYWSVDAPWKNSTRASAYDLSPFDETILMDADYLIGSSILNRLWGCKQDYAVGKRAEMLSGAPLDMREKRLNVIGVDMYWATVVYWKRGEAAETLFRTVEHVRDNYEEYQSIYGFPGNLFRNDYAFSIALHILNGWMSVPHDPILPDILTSGDDDELIEIGDGFRILVNDTEHRYLFSPVAIRGENVHVMNKFSIVRQLEGMKERWNESL